jgi:hypothetical protein
MAQTLYPPPGPQSVGRVLDSGFRIFRISLVSCLLYGALSMIAGQLPNIYLIATGKPLVSFGNGDPAWIVLYIIGTMITLVFWGAMLFRQRGIAVGNRLSSRTELWGAIRKLPANVGLMLITIALVAVTVGGGAIVAYALGIALVPQNYLAIAAISLVIAIPLVYLATPLVMSGIALLLEDLGPWSAVRYSTRLTRGNWWRINAVLTIAIVVITVYYGVILMIVGMLAPLLGATDFTTVSALGGVIGVVLGSLGMPFLSAVMLAVFGDLKVRREGVDLERRVAGIGQE